MNNIRSGARPYGKGDVRYFTGNVTIDPWVDAPHSTGMFGANVHFEPGARTVWHTHLLGQILIVTSGCGLVQRWIRKPGNSGLEVSARGLGCMGMSMNYGPFANEMLVGKTLAQVCDKVVIATRFGFDIDIETGVRRGLNSPREHIRQAIDGSLNLC